MSGKAIGGLIARLRNQGVVLSIAEDELKCHAPGGVLDEELLQAIRQNKAELIDFVRQHVASTCDVVLKPLDRERTNRLPLSYAQQRLWFLEQLEGELTAYNMPMAWRIRGLLDIESLRWAFGAIVQRHEALRTTFTMSGEEPMQVIGSVGQFELPVDDLTSLHAEQRESAVEERCRLEAERRFDLARDLMLRASLLRLSDDEHVLLLTLHHIASDGWSLDILKRELEDFYAAHCRGEDPNPPNLPVQYADYAVWQREELSGARLDAQLKYWRVQLDGLSPLELPSDRPRPSEVTYRGADHAFEIPGKLVEQLKSLERTEGVTLHMILLAAFQTLLVRYSGQHDIAVGMPIAGRNHRDLESLIGFFVNTLVLRTDFSGAPSFRELLSRVRQASLAAYDHQELPFERLVEAMRPERQRNRSPLFQVMFQLLDFSERELSLGELEVSAMQLGYERVRCDLEMHLWRKPDRLSGLVIYSTDLFDGMTIERMVGHLMQLLDGIVADPDRRISELPILTQSERTQLLAWNDTAADYPQRCVHQLFEEQAERSPSAVAVAFNNQQLTYRELNERANQLAHHLREQGVQTDMRVGIGVERSLEMVVGLLGILKAGGAYVPLDPDYPRERLGFMLEDADVDLLVTTTALEARFPSVGGPRVVLLDSEESGFHAYPTSNPIDGQGPDDLVYVTYTSGTTGRPKGIAIRHRGVVRLVRNTDYIAFSAERVFLQLAALSFDAATFEIWGALLNGARLVIAPPGRITPSILGDHVRDYCVNTLWLTSGLFNLLVDQRELDGLVGLDNLLVGGETLSPPHVRQAVERLESTRLINGYGPTENTTFTCYFPIEEVSGETAIPIGRPIANTQVYILDGEHQRVPIGVPGELCIAGDGLARGYLNDAELSAQQFITMSGLQLGLAQETSVRLYKSGDRARWRSDGNLEFLGRLDHQVKVRGFRVEPGEIEALLNQHPSVSQSLVVLREDRPGDKRLVGYYVPANDIQQDLGQLVWHLREHLPDYLVPSNLVAVGALPLTAHGKIDFEALPKPDEQDWRGGAEYLAPRTPIEQELAKVWGDVLGLERIGVHDNFFDLGGHSLLGLQMVSKVEQRLGVSLPLPALFRFSTIEAMASAISMGAAEKPSRETGFTAGGRPGLGLSSVEYRKMLEAIAGCRVTPVRPGSLIVGLNSDGSEIPLFWCFNRLSWEAPNLARGLGVEQPLYGLFSGSEVVHLDEDWRRRLASYYVAEIKKTNPKGPYRIGGNCGGGWIACEIAFQLLVQGEEVDRLCIMEYFEPRLFEYSEPLQFLIGVESDLRVQEKFNWNEPEWEKPFQNKPTVNLLPGPHGWFFREPYVHVLAEKVQRFLRRRTPLAHGIEKTRTAVLILGMHRSGTSALTRVINLLGAELPSSLEPPNRYNAAGHWESRDLMRLHDRLLNSAGSSWDDWTAIDPNWFRSDVARKFADEANEELDRAFHDAPLFVLKDPRICRFLPFWLSIFEQRGIQPIALLPLRNPLDVAASLKNRDQFPRAKSALLWMRYVLDAEMGSREIPRLFVTYDQLITDWRGLEARLRDCFGSRFPPYSPESERVIDSFLSEGYRHHANPELPVEGDPEMVRGIAQTYRIMLELANGEDDGDSTHQCLDELRWELDRATRIFSIVLKDERDRWSIKHESDLVDLKKHYEDELQRRQQGAPQEVGKFQVRRQAERWRRQTVALRSEKISLLQHFNDIQNSASWRLAKLIYRFEKNHSNLAIKALEVLRRLWWSVRLKQNEYVARRDRLIRIQDSGLFDEAWYISNNPEVVVNDSLPILHWMELGWKEGRSPHPLFDVGWYLERCPEAAQNEKDPVSYYLGHGAPDCPDPSPLFDNGFYIENCPQAGESRFTPLEHYLREGAAQGYSPSPLFVHDFYMQQSPDFELGSMAPLVHYIKYGADAGRDPNPYFDSLWYLEQYPHVAQSGINPLIHYLDSGAREGCNPSSRFDSRAYLARLSKFEESRVNPLAHFLRKAKEEGFQLAELDLGVVDDPDWPFLKTLIPCHDDWEKLVPLAADRTDGIMVVDWRTPTPGRDSGSSRMIKILECLSETGRPVFFVGDRDAHSPEYLERVQELGINAVIGFSEAVKLLQSVGTSLETVILSRPTVAERYLPLVRAFAIHATVVYDPGWAELAEETVQHKLLELTNIATCDAVLASTEEERDILKSEAPEAVVYLLPSIHAGDSATVGLREVVNIFELVASDMPDSMKREAGGTSLC